MPLVTWVACRAAAITSGDTISLPFRIALVASNWYERLFVPLSVVLFGGIVVVGFISTRASFQEKRNALLSWVSIAAASLALEVGIWWLPFDLLAGNAAVKLVILSSLLGAVAIMAAVVLAVQVQGIVSKTSSTRVRGWHIAVCGTLLLFLGPFALLVPIWVLATSARTGEANRVA